MNVLDGRDLTEYIDKCFQDKNYLAILELEKELVANGSKVIKKYPQYEKSINLYLAKIRNWPLADS